MIFNDLVKISKYNYQIQQITCHLKAQCHEILYFSIPDAANISSQSFFLKDLSTDSGASFLTILDLEKKYVSNFIE